MKVEGKVSPSVRPDRAPSMTAQMLPFASGGVGSGNHALQLRPAGAVAKLDPQEISDGALEVARQLRMDAQSRNTVRAEDSVRAYWAAWFLVRYGVRIQLPVPVAAVMQFIADHALVRKSAESEEFVLGMPAEADAALVDAGVKKARGALALGTIVHRISVLSMMHSRWLAQQPLGSAGAAVGNPCLDPRVRQMLKNLRRTYGKRNAAAPKKKPPLTADLLKRVLATCDESLIGIRDRAILAVAFSSGGRRRSELAGMQLQLLQRTDSGYRYYLAHSKTNQEGTDKDTNWKPVQGLAASALSAWVAAMARQKVDTKDGPLFRKIHRGKTIGATALGTSMIWRIVKRRCESAGLDKAFSPHSLRSGFLTQAGMDGISLPEAMAMSGHEDMAVAKGYMHVGSLERSRAARLLDNSPEETGAPLPVEGKVSPS